MINKTSHFLAIVFAMQFASLLHADQQTPSNNIDEAESPWLITPTLSSDPKMGTSVGAMAAYIRKFDENSPSSMIGATASFSDTDSTIYGVFGRGYFSGDSHRVAAGILQGDIENDYEDFLGTGFDALTTDDLNIKFISYTKRALNDWFIGGQLISMNYGIKGRDDATRILLNTIGLTGFNSNGIGLVIERDTRDNQNSPYSGYMLSMKNVAFRKGLGGDVSFDTYTLKLTSYIEHGKGHVLASRFSGRWTNNAPISAYSSVDLRGYTRGEYLAPYAVTVEVEERYALSEKWSANAFTGAACLYGDSAYCSDSENWFPSLGGGMAYMIKQKERMIIRADLAFGKNESRGFYLKFGHAF